MITDDDARGPYSVQYEPPFRVGIVTAQQITPFAAVRVKFPDRDNIISYWLPISSRCSQDDKDFWMPDLGEQVLCLMDAHDEDGSVLGSVPSTVDTSPSWAAVGVRGFQAWDGAIVTYNRNTHTLTAQLPEGATVNITTGQGSKVVLGSDGTALMQDGIGAFVQCLNTGVVQINGNLRVAGTISSASGTWGNGSATITGTLKATEDIVASTATSNISLTNHVQTNGGGTGDSGPPAAST